MIYVDSLIEASVGTGTLSDRLTDIGIDDEFMKKLDEGLPDGGSAIFVLVWKSSPDKVLDSLDPFRGSGKILQTSLTKENGQELLDLLEKVSA